MAVKIYDSVDRLWDLVRRLGEGLAVDVELESAVGFAQHTDGVPWLKAEKVNGGVLQIQFLLRAGYNSKVKLMAY